MTLTHLRYACLNKTVKTSAGEQTLLDISVSNKIPHWRECGGNARCTTCRVRVLEGSANLSPRSEREKEIAESRGWDASVRLACQTRLLGEATVERIVLRGADTSQIQLETVGGDTGEERTVALLFCDMRGFTRFAEAHSAFDVVHILNRFFAAVGEPILVNGGIIYQYVGDEISGLFGLDGGSARRACEAAIRAALGMRDSLNALNETLEAEFGVGIAIGIGVHYGPLVVGKVGHPVRRQFSVVGDNVNTASRIQTLTKSVESNLLVSQDVIEHLPADTLSIAETQMTRLRGRKESIRVYAVDGFLSLDNFLVVQRTMQPLLGADSGFAEAFYARLFVLDPALEKMFVNGVEAQGQMLEYILRGVVFGRGRSNHLALGLHDLGAKHVAYGVEEGHYELFRTVMLETIEAILGPSAYTGDVAEAWSATTDMVLGLMKGGAAGVN